jgi:hypothetical protein
MTHVLIILTILSVLELLLYLPALWHLRKPFACLLIIALSLASGWLVSAHLGVLTGLAFIASLYRVVNLLRLVEGRTPVDYMMATTRRTSIILISTQLMLLGLSALEQRFNIIFASWIGLAATVDLLAAVFLLGTTLKNIRKTEVAATHHHYAERDLPTLSVAIPARNETDDLKACLDSLVASSYPKLEILVLDDCSQNKHTPDIIKDFAHAGVRFIAGKTPPKHWLAKNYAYQQLLEEANGEIVLFCGVDTIFQVTSLEAMVTTLLAQKMSMISILPHNVLAASLNPEASVVQPLRYGWELALPRNWLKRPPVLSTCWLISAKLLTSSGGFKAITNSTSVESYFARLAAAKPNGYGFFQSGKLFGLSSHKSTSEQRATAIRTRYPQMHRRPELVMAVSLAELILLVLPYALFVYALASQSWLMVVAGIANLALLDIFYGRIMAVTYGAPLIRSFWLVPCAAVYDVAVLNYSMWRYEFSEVIWKGRNVCIPLTYAVPAPESSM